MIKKEQKQKGHKPVSSSSYGLGKVKDYEDSSLSMKQSLKSKSLISKNPEEPHSRNSKNCIPMTTRITDFFTHASDSTQKQLQSNFGMKDKEMSQLAEQKIKELEKSQEELTGKLESLEKDYLKKSLMVRDLQLQKEQIGFQLRHIVEKVQQEIPKIVFDLEQKKIRQKFENLALKKHQYGFLKNSSARSLSEWIDGSKLYSLKNQVSNLTMEIKKIEQKKQELRHSKKNKAIENNKFQEKKNRLNASHHQLKLRIESLNKKIQKINQIKIEIVLADKQFEESLSCKLNRQNPILGLEAWPLLKNQYQILTLLGKGGFAEVYKAYDIKNFRYVVCKIQFLDKSMPIHSRDAFIKYANREHDVFKNLDHPNIVKYIDSVDLGDLALCIVLEYCEGGDLDHKIRLNKQLSEKESKGIIGKVVEAVKYLNELDKPIIHYDLKPENEVKITDFGLCKQLQSEETKIQLTSIGCGTFYYLPPECFQNDEEIMISSKVDVWSIGIIFYFLLYGKKPFYAKMGTKHYSQMINNSHLRLSFPSKPIVSDHSKYFIEQCLTRNVQVRPSVLEMYEIFHNSNQFIMGNNNQKQLEQIHRKITSFRFDSEEHINKIMRSYDEFESRIDFRFNKIDLMRNKENKVVARIQHRFSNKRIFEMFFHMYVLRKEIQNKYLLQFHYLFTQKDETSFSPVYVINFIVDYPYNDLRSEIKERILLGKYFSLKQLEKILKAGVSVLNSFYEAGYDYSFILDQFSICFYDREFSEELKVRIKEFNVKQQKHPKNIQFELKENQKGRITEQ